MEIVNLSEFEPDWNWLKKGFGDSVPDLQWKHASSQEAEIPGWTPRPHTAKRIAAAWKTRALVHDRNAVLVSHGPRMTAYGALANRLNSPFDHHVAYSFNFTNLPTGLELKLFQVSLGHVDKFVVFSNMERSLYSEYFQIDASKIDMIHWAVRPPQVDSTRAPLIDGKYICAIGSQGRDYQSLFNAMTRLPSIKLIVVGTPQTLAGLVIPPNVEVRMNIPLADVYNVLAHSVFMVLPLAHSQVPCGHVTLVSALHLGTPILATDSIGISDYVRHGVTGRLVEAREPIAMANEIEALFSSPEECRQLAENGKAFARTHCEETHVVRYFAELLKSCVGKR